MKKSNLSSHIAMPLSDKIVQFINTVLLMILLLIFVYPLIYVFTSSISANAYNISGLRLIPEKISWEGYKAVLQFKRIWSGYRNSIVYMLLGTTLNVFMSVCAAYPLSNRKLYGHGVILGVMMFTMYFGGGMIPSYLLVRNLGMIDTIWAMIIPGAMSVYNTLVMRTYFINQIPNELQEAAEIDGCSQLRYLISILLPLSMPILAVVGMFYAVGHWNAYFNALMYMRTPDKYPLQLVIREILIVNRTSEILNFDPEDLLILEQRANLMKYSLIVISSLPMLCLYPFIQKHFVSGIMLGAVKG